jgi:alpha-1,6-mannosyltransferase
MKIVDVCAFYAPKGGGVRTYVERKLAAAAVTGHEIVVIAPGKYERIEQRGVGARIVYLASPRFPLDPNYRYFDDEAALHAALDREAPDLVEVSSPWRSAVMVAAWRGTAPRAIVMHADPLAAYAYRWLGLVARRETIDRQFDWYWRRLRTFDRQFDLVVSASAGLTARLTAGGLRHVVTHPMGVEAGRFSPVLRDEALRTRMLERCALPEDATLLIGIGRHAPEKRWPLVIDAVAAAGVDRPVGLILVGDGRERARIVRAVDGNPHIQLLSPIDDRAALARLLASADTLIHGCEAETFCMVAAEARASGVPIVVPDAGGAADHALAGVGSCYPAANATAAAGILSRHLAEIAQMRASAIARAAEVRTMGQHFEALFAHYAALSAGARRAA